MYIVLLQCMIWCVQKHCQGSFRHARLLYGLKKLLFIFVFLLGSCLLLGLLLTSEKLEKSDGFEHNSAVCQGAPGVDAHHFHHGTDINKRAQV